MCFNKTDIRNATQASLYNTNNYYGTWFISILANSVVCVLFMAVTVLIVNVRDSLVVECWLRVQEVPGSIPSQGPRHTKDVIKMVPVVPLFGTQH